MANYVWDLRNPDGASTGMPWGRARMAARDAILAHSLPERVDVEVRTADGEIVAKGENLSDPRLTSPMARLMIREGAVTRTNLWPDESDIGKLVILPGGEVGILLEWWNAPDGHCWRWRVEFQNSR